MQSNDTETNKFNQIIQLIRNNPTEREYFFRKLANASKPEEWIQYVSEEGYLDPKNNPRPMTAVEDPNDFQFPYWNVLDFLVNVADKNIKLNNQEITNYISQFIDGIIEYKDIEGKRIENYRTDWVVSKLIFKLPPDYILNKHIDFIGSILNSRWTNILIAESLNEIGIQKLIDSNLKDLLVKLLDYLWAYKIPSENTVISEYTSILDRHRLKSIMDKYRKKIATLCKADAIVVIEKKMREILKNDSSRFGLVWIQNLDGNAKDYQLDRYELQIVLFMRDLLLESEKDYVNDKLKEYLADEHSIFKRLALFILDKRYKEFSSILWSLTDNPLSYEYTKHEIYCLFENHSEYFNKAQIDMIINWITNKTYRHLEENVEDENEKKNIIAYRNKEWLSSLIKSKDQRIKILYDEYDNINPSKLSHPGYDIWTGDPEWIDDVQDKTQLVNKTIAEVKEIYLNIGNKGINPDIANYDDHGDRLYYYVAENAIEFSNNLDGFNKLHPYFLNNAINGFKEAWRKSVLFNWGNVLRLFNEILRDKNFWQIEYDDQSYNYRNWIMRNICELIEEGVRKDSHAFDPEYLDNAKDILLLIEDKAVESLEYIMNLTATVMNSVGGIVYSAIMNLALRYARLYRRKNEKRFDKDILNLFNKRLTKNSPLTFFHTLGKFMPNLLFLDRSWVFDHINNIFPKDHNEEAWKFAMDGYLYFGTNVYHDVYVALRDNGHLVKALDTEFDDAELNTRLIQNICIAYLNDWERIDNADPLLDKILTDQKHSELSVIINFIWLQRDFIIEKGLHEKIVTLMERIYQSIQNIKLAKDKNGLLGELNYWIIFFNNLDRKITFDIFKETVKYSSASFTTMDLLKQLQIIIEPNPLEAFELLKMLIEYEDKNSWFGDEEFRKIFDAFDKMKKKEEIKILCNMLIHKKYFQYKDIMKEYIN